MTNETVETRIQINNNLEAADLFGKHDVNLRYIEKNYEAKINARGGEIVISGGTREVEMAAALFQHLLALVRAGNAITIPDINYAMGLVKMGQSGDAAGSLSEVILNTFRGKPIKAKTLGQMRYTQAIRQNDIVFAIGPAGTGKTYLAVVMAVEALRSKTVGRIILVRPAVEAGEKLGFLPGDLQEKVDPYLRPLYDGLYDVMGLEMAQRYMQKNVIEVAPLAYMRGRTLNDAFIILDEAQNTTPEQMKMFLTRLGFGSKAVITGDITQVDLPKGNYSGLVEVQNILKDTEGISFQYLTARDTVRHPLVQNVIHAYEKWESRLEAETRE
ncbi:MAG: PhoH family protein [Firmicutes bacterium]|nr:PhoH family protein [Bacillota bacterium]